MAATLLDGGGLLCTEEADSYFFPDSPSGQSETLSDVSSSASFNPSSCQCSSKCPLPAHHGLRPRTSHKPRPSLEELKECIGVLTQQELHHLPPLNYLHQLQQETVCPHRRGDAVWWIMEVRNSSSYSLLTASLAVNYLDRFLALHPLPPDAEWPMQLVAVACMSIAAKMEEVDMTYLSDIQSKAPCRVKPELSRRMELIVLTTLQWRVHGVTSFSFVDPYLAAIGADGGLAEALERRVSELLVQALLDVRFATMRPSTTTAAALMHALCELPRRDAQVYQAALLEVLLVKPGVLERSMRLLAEVANSATNSASCAAARDTPRPMDVDPQVLDMPSQRITPPRASWAQAAKNSAGDVAARVLPSDGVTVSGKRKRHSLASHG